MGNMEKGDVMKTKVLELEKDLKMTLLARIVPNLPLDETRKWVKDIVKKFEFGYYFKETEKLTREECEKEKPKMVASMKPWITEKDLEESHETGCSDGAVNENQRIRSEVEKKKAPYDGNEFKRGYEEAIGDVLKILEAKGVNPKQSG